MRVLVFADMDRSWGRRYLPGQLKRAEQGYLGRIDCHVPEAADDLPLVVGHIEPQFELSRLTWPTLLDRLPAVRGRRAVGYTHADHGHQPALLHVNW